ncbi:hypothetical protein DRI50_04775 [candidate division KSB1 bacterium]|nr:MAG: hypothetical protein DRI50_04775 [candidate division KSB1 bacterium]
MKRNRNKSTGLQAVMRREFERIRTRKTLWMLIIVMPALIFGVIAYIYSAGVVKNLPVAVYDQDNSALSRLIVRSLAANRSFEIVCYAQNIEQIKRDFKRGKIQAAIYIPQGTERKIKKGQSAHVVFYKNSSNIIIGNIAFKAAMTTLRTISAGVELRKLQAMGNMPQQALSKILPIEVHTQALYNPAYNYENYLVSGLLPILYQMIVMISAVLVISAEIKERTIQEAFRIANENIFTLALGKALPHLSLHFAGIMLLVGIVFPLFGIPVHGPTIGLIAYLLYFVLVAFALGMFLSCLFTDMMLATEAAIFLSTPAFIFTGYTFPLEAMPRIHYWYAQLLPSTHFMSGFIKIYQMGTPVQFILPELGSLTVFLVLSLSGLFGLMFWRKRKWCGTQISTQEA